MQKIARDRRGRFTPHDQMLLRPIDLTRQVMSEEVIHPMRCVVEDMRASEVMKFAGIPHERKQGAFALFERFVDEPYGFEIGNVNVGCAMQHKQQTSDSVGGR